MVQRRRRHDRRLVGRVQQPAGRGPPAAGAEGHRDVLRERRPLRRRRALPRRLRPRHGHAAVGHLHAGLQRQAARPGQRRRGVAGALAAPARRDAAVHRAVARPPAPRRLLAARLGVRGLRRHRLSGPGRRRLGGRLHRRGAAAARAPAGAAPRDHRPVGPRRRGRRRRRARTSGCCRSCALVRPLAARRRQRRRWTGRCCGPTCRSGTTPATRLDDAARALGRSGQWPESDRRRSTLGLGDRRLGPAIQRRRRTSCAACRPPASTPAPGAPTATPTTCRPTSGPTTGAR